MALLDIATADYDVELDLRYASARNFTGKPVYARAGAYLHADAAAALRVAIELAAAVGLRLRIFDAYRPSEAQWILWNHTPDPEFLADPRTGSPHSRGVAVDLTLIDAQGRALDMGTDFDAFTPRAHHGDTEIPAEAQRNRFILLGLMTAAGWELYRNEWWHYQLFDAHARYPLYADADLPVSMMTL